MNTNTASINNLNKKLNKIIIKVEPNPEFAQRNPKGVIAKIENFFVKTQDYLWLVHGAMFLLFLVLLIVPPFLPEPLHGMTPLNNFTEFALFLVWGVWFPFVFLSVIFTGRSWCGLLCPMGAASEWANKKGFQRQIPGWLRSPLAPIVSFVIVTILGQTLDVRDQPIGMAEIFLLTLLAAVLIGLFYGKKKRAWCRHACPIGLLLGVFSRLGAIQFTQKHKYKDQKGDGYTEKGVCPTMIAVSHKQESRHCIECFRCVKPESPGGLFMRLRKPGEEIEKISSHNPNASEVWFLFLSTGIALGGFLWLILPNYQQIRQSVATFFIMRGWDWIGNIGPSWLMSVHPAQRQVFNWLDFLTIVGYMLGWMLLSLAVLGTCNALSTWLAGKNKLSFKKRFVELGYQFAPIAMISIIISLSGKLFDFLQLVAVPDTVMMTIKSIVFIAAIIWSVYLGNKILKAQQSSVINRVLALIPSTIGTLLVAFAWWPAIFGLSIPLL